MRSVAMPTVPRPREERRVHGASARPARRVVIDLTQDDDDEAPVASRRQPARSDQQPGVWRRRRGHAGDDGHRRHTETDIPEFDDIGDHALLSVGHLRNPYSFLAEWMPSAYESEEN